MLSITASCMLVGCGTNETLKEDQTQQVTETSVTTETETDSETETIETEDNNGVSLGDYSAFTYSRVYIPPTDDDVENEIKETMEESISMTYTDEGVVKEGDTIVVSFSGSIDGEIMDGFSGEEEEFTVGEGAFIDEFESAMIGHEVGEEFDITIDFPQDYEDEDIAGKTAVLNTIINSIAEPAEEVELTDTWVLENTNYKTVEEYKKSVKEKLEDQANESADLIAIYELLSNLYSVSYADVTEEELAAGLEEELDTYREEAERLEMTYEEYVQEMYSVRVVDFEKDKETEMKSVLSNQKILNAFAEKEGVDLSEAAYQEYLEKEAKLYGYESKEALVYEMENLNFESFLKNLFLETQVGRKLMELSELTQETELDTEQIKAALNETELFSEAESEFSTEADLIEIDVESEFVIE